MTKPVVMIGSDPESNYVKKLLARLNEGELMKPGVHITTIKHDHWCKLLKGKGACNCDPDIE